MGRENVKNIQLSTLICYCLGGGGDLKLRGDISPPKGPEKSTVRRAAEYSVAD